MNIIKEIGMPAMLEQLGEECCELGQAAMKLARKRRNENPTPKTDIDCQVDLCEEMADVMLCINLIIDSGLISHESIESYIVEKESRWKERLADRTREKLKRELEMKGE